MACPDASAAIHECVLAIKARVPIEVLADTIHAFPSTSRILNGLFAEAAKDLAAAADGSGSALERDLAVDHDEPRSGRRERAAGLDRLGDRALRRQDDEVGPLARDQAPAIRLRGRDGRARRTRRGAPARGSAPRPARTARCPAGHDPSTRVTAIARPGHGSIGSTGASVPNATTAPASSSERNG